MHDPNHSPLKDLERAPLLDPPDTLWPRLRDRQRKAVARGRMLAGASASALALLFIVLMPWSPLLPMQEPHPNSIANDNDDVLEQIVSVDRALQAAYDRGASDDEIEPMWKVRHVLVARMNPGSTGESRKQQGI